MRLILCSNSAGKRIKPNKLNLINYHEKSTHLSLDYRYVRSVQQQ